MDLTTLPAMDVASRAGRVRSALADTEASALLVSKLTNVRYLTGFTGSAGRVVVLPDRLVLVTDGRYGEQARAQLDAAGVEADVVVELTMASQNTSIADAVAGESVGFEADHVTVAEHRAMVGDWLSGCSLVELTGIVEALRLQKDDGEVARIEAAAAIASEALEQLRGRLLSEPTEQEFGIALDLRMRELGASAPSFETIVASGPNGAKPHHRPGSRRIVDGDLVVLDFGAKVDGYCSDMTRTVCIGTPTAEQQRMLDVVASAQAAGVAAVRSGAPCVAVDEACRSIIREAGWADAFSHGTGHGVGLDIHEDPRVTFSVDPTATLADRSVVTVEPGVYLPDHGGVRIEDSLLVAGAGARCLTHAPKDPQWPSRPTT